MPLEYEQSSAGRRRRTFWKSDAGGFVQMGIVLTAIAIGVILIPLLWLAHAR